MTRAVRAVLIAVSETAAAPGMPVEDAAVIAARLGAHLCARFERHTIVSITSAASPVTKATVLAAIEEARPAPGELFVVLFFGHGLPADAAHAYQGWALSGHEELTDVELAAALHRLPAGVDTVVISACCYGRGLYRAGPKAFGMPGGPPPVIPSLAPLARLAGSGGPRDAVSAPMVCISAAGADAERGAVLEAVAGDLVTELLDAAEQRESYLALRERFRRRAYAGREFHVDARPEARLADVVLAA